MQAGTAVSRRSALRLAGLAGLGFAWGMRRREAAQTATAFCLCGDESHNSDYIRTALTRTLVEGAGLSIDFTDQEKLLSYENLKSYRILIMFRDGLRFPNGYYQHLYWNGRAADYIGDPPLDIAIGGRGVGWMTAAQGAGIKAWVEDGGSLWAFHNNSQASLLNRDYRDVEGAIYTGHPPIRPFKVQIVNPDHPITRGVRDFIVTDEQHFVTYDKDPKYVLARSINENGLEFTDQAGRRSHSAEAVWAYDYGKGRVCFMAPGHMIPVLWNPEYMKMQKNAVRWLLRET